MKKLAAILIFLQFLDGLFTYIGVKRFGVEAEGNPIIKWLIETLGLECGLLGVKLAACIIIVCMVRYCQSKTTSNLLKLLIFLYSNVVFLWIYGLLKTWNASSFSF